MSGAGWRRTFLLLVSLMAASPMARAETHPRIWLTPTLLSTLRMRAASGDADWLRVKADADRLLTQPTPRFTVTGATNSNPVQFTIAEVVPWSGSTPMFIGGARGPWAAVNAGGDRPSPLPATRVAAHVISIPIDSTTFGSFRGQQLALFFSDGGYSGYGYEGLDWQTSLQFLGLAYQVTGNTAYAAKGIELIDYIASLGAAGMVAPEAIDSGFPSRSAIYGLALGYDWLHEEMTAGERAAAVEAINLWLDWFKRAAFENNGPAYGNYFGGHILGFGLAGLATHAENPRGSEIVSDIAGLFQRYVAPAFAAGGFAGGYPVESYTYGANHFQRLLSYMLAVKTATGDDIVGRTDFAQKIARNLLYNLKPNDWQTSDEADFSGDSTGVLQPSLPIVLSYVLAGSEEGKWMQFLSQHLAPAQHGGQEADAFVEFLFGDRTRSAADYRLSQATWLHSSGDEHVYRRSSWRADAVWTSFAGGAAWWAEHQMRAAGHLAIQRGNDYLLVNSGQWKGPTGDFGTPQAFDLRSWRGNTLFVDDFGDYLFTGADYRGGQGNWGTNHVLAADGSADFAYMKTDLTSAYSVGDYKPWDSRSVRYFYRNVLSMGGGVTVVFDRAGFLKPNYIKKLYFHLNPAGGPPAIEGDTASIRIGSSALFVRSLLPAAPVLAVAADPVSDSDNRPITYRLEVSDSAATATFNALNVFVAAPLSTTAMPSTVGLQSTSGAMVGAAVADGDVQRIGLFSADGAPQSDVSYSVTPLAQGRTSFHVLCDLVPHAQYSITRKGLMMGSFVVSSQGVLTFTSPPGGTFVISKVTSTAPATRRSDGTRAPVLSRSSTTPTTITASDSTAVVSANPASDGSRFVTMVAPLAGEQFTAPSTLRLIAVGRDPNVETNYPAAGLGGNAARMQFFVDDTMVLQVDGSQAEFFVFKGFVSRIASGQHRVWARAFYQDPTLVLDSAPVVISVHAPPMYARTIDLTADLPVVGDFQLTGSPSRRIRVNGNGHRVLSGAGGSRTVVVRHVDFFDVGDRTSTDVPGIDLMASGGLTVEDCSFDGSNTVRFAVNGLAAATIRSNTFRSNMRQPLGQYPDGYGGIPHGSFPALILSGTSTVLKVFQANNVAAGWVTFETTQDWLVGGATAEEGNVLIGPRVGVFVDRSTRVQIRRNYSHHIYFGGWSQGSNFELGGAASVTAEHNIIVGSSWPVRGVGGEFRYNLVLDAGHEWLWADHDGAYVHHNVFAGGDNDVGGIYVLYGVRNVRIEHNTLDGLNAVTAAAGVDIADGVASVTSNLFYRLPGTSVALGRGSVSADDNLAWECGSPVYSDGRVPFHDVRVDPRLAAPVSSIHDLDERRLWTREATVSDVLALYRANYSPEAGSPALHDGDPARGQDDSIGAIGSATSAADRFGR